MPLIDDLFPKSYPLTDFICYPFVARGSVTLLHGKKSLGKSPFSWEMARCKANGLPFLGFPCEKGKVLFVEKDTPEQLSMTRLQKMPEPRGGWYVEFLTQVPFDLAAIHPCQARLRGYEERWGPFDLVVWNPLARLFKGTDRDIPARVYDTMTHLFPLAGHLVISHDRKTDRTPGALTVDSEEHAGWQTWTDLAQNVFRLTRQGDTHLRLLHTGSQTSKKQPSIDFTLTCDNSSVEIYERVPDIVDLLARAPGRTQREKVAHVAAVTKRSETTIWRAIRDSKNYSNLSD